MAKLNEYDDELARGRVAREEFIARYCAKWPAVYRTLCPVTTSAKKLFAWKEMTEAAMAADFATYLAEQNSPWLKLGEKCRYVDYSELAATDKVSIGLADEGLTFGPDVSLPHPVKFGEGSDPSDGHRKAFADFKEVIELRKRFGQATDVDSVSTIENA